jgi:hypothetical protein
MYCGPTAALKYAAINATDKKIPKQSPAVHKMWHLLQLSVLLHNLHVVLAVDEVMKSFKIK